MEVSSHLHTPAALPLREVLSVPFGLQRYYSHSGEEKLSLPKPGKESRSIRSYFVAVVFELSRNG